MLGPKEYKKKYHLGFYMEEDSVLKLRKISRDTERSLSNVIVTILEKFLGENEKEKK